MTGAVKVTDIVETWDSTDPWTAFYLDRKTGEIIPITHAELDLAEKPFLVETEPDGKPDIKRIARAILNGDERYVLLPSLHDLDVFAIMERFCASLEDDQISGNLSEALTNFQGMELFEQTVIRHGLVEFWQSHLHLEKLIAAKAWCEKNDIDFTDDVQV